MSTNSGNSPRTNRTKSNRGLTRPQIIAIAGIFIAAIIALSVPFLEPAADIWVRNLIGSLTPTEPSKNIINSTQPQPETYTPLPRSLKFSPSSTTTAELTPTATWTETPMSTPTITSTSTLTPIPPGTILFEDNFDNGLSPNWTVFFGEPILAQGQLSGNGRTLISVGDVGWKNYKISMKVRLGYTNLQPENPPQVIPRFIDPENYIGYKLNMWSWKAVWVEAKNGSDWTNIPNSANYGMKTFEWHTFQMIVEDNKYTVYIDEVKVSEFISSKYPNGGVGFLLDTISLIDDMQVIALP